MASAVSDSDPASENASPPHESVSASAYDDGIVGLFAAATILWGAGVMLGGLVVGLMLVMPRLLSGWEAAEVLNFAGLRPVHSNAAVFAFIGNAVFTGIYYSTQRLCGRAMWSRGLSLLHFAAWQLIILGASVAVLLGYRQSRPLAEWEWPFDLALAVTWIGFFGVNFMMTVYRRRVRDLYVSLWFYIATVIGIAIFFVGNNLAIPAGRLGSYPFFSGMQDAFMQWWYGYNLLAFLLLMPFLGFMYHFVPKAAGVPVYSRRLAVVQFWTLLLVCIWAGPHHVHYTPLPQWTATLAMLMGFMLWMPAWGGLVNGMMTLLGSGRRAFADPVLRFYTAALLFYGWATFEGPLLCVNTVNAVANYTDWMIAHVHVTALGWSGMMVFGMFYWLMPRIFRRGLWSPKSVNIHFLLALAGTLVYVIPIYIAGIGQGRRLLGLDASGRLLYFEFFEAIEFSIPLWWIRLVGGVLYLAGAVLLGVNFLMTWMAAASAGPVTVTDEDAFASDVGGEEDEVLATAPSALEDKPVLELGKRLDVWSRGEWHRRWERAPMKLAWLVLLAILGISALGMVPMFLIRGEAAGRDEARPYTPLELVGRDIYINEGCVSCHSQMVRRLVGETLRYGDYSEASDSYYDRPVLWGTRRIGPDLARRGGVRQSFWLWQHLESPDEMTPGSVMPSYRHLLDRELDFDKTLERVAAAHRLGVPYDRELTEAPAMARRQSEEVTADIVSQGGPVKRGEMLIMNSQAIALIAYLQRLGAEPPVETPPAEADAGVTEPAESP